VAAAAQLKAEGISARVINLSTVSPLDTTEILAAAKETKAIITAEESVTTVVESVVASVEALPPHAVKPAAMKSANSTFFILLFF
jgi:transketolase C-terminal domain/subunit